MTSAFGEQPSQFSTVSARFPGSPKLLAFLAPCRMVYPLVGFQLVTNWSPEATMVTKAGAGGGPIHKEADEADG